MKLGISGVLTRASIASPLTPLFLVAALIVGALALLALPREEEPQISVPMVDILVTANGYKAGDAIELITKPLEDIVKGINGVEHVYSSTQDDAVLVTARFFVGTDEDTALPAHPRKDPRQHRRPTQGHSRTADHRPRHQRRGDRDPDAGTQAGIGRALDGQRAVPDRRRAPARAGQGRQRRPELHRRRQSQPDPGRARSGASRALRHHPQPAGRQAGNANRSFLVGAFRQLDQNLPVVAGQTLQGVPDIGLLLLTSRDGRPVYVKDVADVVVGAAEAGHRTWTLTRHLGGRPRAPPDGDRGLRQAQRRQCGGRGRRSSSTRLKTVQGRLVPDDITVTVSRNYGGTATEKADELLFHLALATVSIVLLITLAIGWREGVVVLVVIPTTILLTLFASWLMGYTINRVSLFALIFSIGILVDDAIVVVENIVRHWQARRGTDLQTAAIEAVDEVGNPTIVATLTIIVALLPMMFVSGLMGPYMSPIPANASMAMVFSFFVAVTITPWLLYRLAGRHFARASADGAAAGGHDEVGRLGRFYLRIARPLLTGRRLRQALPRHRRRGDRRRLRAVRHARRHGETAALRQQVGAAGGRRPAAVEHARGYRALPDGRRRAPEGPAGADVDPDLCRHGGALQLQRAGAALLSAEQSGARRSADQPSAQGRARRAPATPSPSTSASGWTAWPSRREPPSGSSRCRPGRPCWRRCSPRSTAPTSRRVGKPRRRCVRLSRRSRSWSTSTTLSISRPNGCAFRSTRKTSNSTVSTSRPCTTRSPPSSAA